jgi:hypothetical protein
MATIPRLQPKPPPPPEPPPPATYSLAEMLAFGWIGQSVHLPDGRFVVPRTPDPRIPSGIDPRISRKDET